MNSRVFLSHASEDRTIAERLCRFLESHGWRCWLAPRDLPTGSEWPEQILNAIEESAALVALISEHALRSDPVKNELAHAAQRRLQIFPLRIDGVALTPFFQFHLNRLHILSTTPGSLGQALKQLEDALRASSMPTAPPEPKARPSKARPERVPAPRAQDGKQRASSSGSVSAPAGALINPYDFAGTATNLTFKGRDEEIQELLNSIASGTHTAVFGLQRMGKTSLVEGGVAKRLAESPELCNRIILAKIDFQQLGVEVKYKDLVHRIIEAIRAEMIQAGIGGQGADLKHMIDGLFAAGEYERGDRTEFFARLGNVLRLLAERSKRRIVLFIDEFSEVRRVIERNKTVAGRSPDRIRKLLAHELYIDIPFMTHLSALLKDSKLKEAFTLIVSVRPFMAEYDSREQLQVLKLMKPVPLDYLDRKAARALVTEPLQGKLTYEDGAVDYLCYLTAGHPYLIQFILKILVDRLWSRRETRITLTHLRQIEEEMASDGPGYDAHFAVLLCDYSVDEVLHPSEADLGKGALALVARLGDDDGWVSESRLVDELTRHEVPQGKAWTLLGQLVRTRILEVLGAEQGNLCRLSVPLLRRRLLRQNLYLRYFR